MINATLLRGTFNKFPDFFVQAFKIVVDTWRFTKLLLYNLSYDWPIFIISGSNEQLQQQLEYTLLKPDCHCWWISKMQFGREDTLEEQYAIKFCFKLGRNATERMEWFKPLLEHLAWIEHQFLSGIRDSKKAGSLWGLMRGVGGVRKSEYQSWFSKGLGLGLLCWGFYGVQEEIPSEEASSLHIGSVAFPQVAIPQVAFPPGHGCTTWMQTKKKKNGEKAWRKLHKNAASNSEHVLEATPHKTPTVWPPTSHHKN